MSRGTEEQRGRGEKEQRRTYFFFSISPLHLCTSAPLPPYSRAPLLLCFLLILISFLCSSGMALASSKELKSEGISLLEGIDIEKSKREALDDAFKKILIQATENLVAKDKMTDRYADFQRIFLLNKEKYLRSFKIMYEINVGDYYQVGVSGEVEMEKLKEDLILHGFLAREMEQKPVNTMKVELRDFGSYPNFSSLYEFLKETKGVEKMALELIAPQRCQFRLEFRGSLDDLIEEIRNSEFGIRNSYIKVMKANEKTLIIDMGER